MRGPTNEALLLEVRMEEAPALNDGYPRPFGSYVLLTAFAHGGMGEVYLAKTGGIAGIERICVLKKLRPDFGQNQEYVNRFLDEARLVVQLNHANIAHVFDVGQVGSEYYLAMEYVSGVSLRGLLGRALERGTQLPPDVAMFALAEALEALDYAHRLEHPMTGQALNLVHRDVSPHNVMVSYEGEVKLIDFGLAASELKEEQTESQVVMGKVAYMAPEQARGERVDARCDQFAAGIMAYELLAHERFYGEMTNYQIWQVVGRGGFTPAKWGLLDDGLRPILAKALHGDVKQRFATCGDFKDAITDWLIERYPKTTRKTLREAVRGLFDGDTDKERMFLQRVSHVTALSARESNAPVERTQSYSNAIAPGPATVDAPPARTVAQRPVHELTDVVPKRPPLASGGRRRAVAAGVALVVVGSALGFVLVRSGGKGSGASPAERRATVALQEPLAEEPAAPVVVDEQAVASDTEPSGDVIEAAMDDRQPGVDDESASEHEEPVVVDVVPSAAEQAPLAEPRAVAQKPRQRRGQKKRAAAPAVIGDENVVAAARAPSSEDVPAPTAKASDVGVPDDKERRRLLKDLHNCPTKGAVIERFVTLLESGKPIPEAGLYTVRENAERCRREKDALK